GEKPVLVPAGPGEVGVQFEEFGTRVNVLPIALRNGRIRLEIEPEVSSLSPANGASISGEAVPRRITQRAHTTTELASGQTFVMGGLSNTKASEDEHALLVLVTPHLLPGGEEQLHNPAPERLRRLEVRLKRLQQEVDDLQREARSLRGAVPAA